MGIFSLKQWGVLLVAIAAVALVAFESGLTNPFIFDDMGKIAENPDIQVDSLELGNFIYPYDRHKLHNRSDPSRPLTFFIFWACWNLGDGNPMPFHVASIFLHILSALLLAVLGAQMARRFGFEAPFLAGLIAGLWFVALPLNAGTVIYAYGMSDVLATTLMLVAVVLAVAEISALKTVAACLFFLLALASKQSAIVIPGLVFAIDFFTNKDWAWLKQRRTLYAALTGTALAYLAVRLAYFGRIGDLEAYNQFSTSIYFPLQGIMFYEYLARIFLPFNLAIEHAVNPSMYTYSQCFLTWGITLAISFSAVRYGRQNPWLAALALGWWAFFICLSPTSTFFTTTDLIVERRAYTPTAFLFAAVAPLIAAGLWQMSRRARLIWSGVLATILVAHVAHARQRMTVYGDQEQLWLEVVTKYPRDERALTNLSTHYLRTNQFEKAFKVLTDLLKMYPGYYAGLINMGGYYQHGANPRREPLKALEFYAQALAQEPTNLGALQNSGILFIELKRYDEARNAFNRTLEFSPRMATAHFNLARIAYEQGDKATALKHIEDTLRLNPEFPQAAELRRYLVPK